MEAIGTVRLKSLKPYLHLFPKAQDADFTVKMGASVYDTVDFIPEIIRKCHWQVEKFVDQELRGLSTHEVCDKLWHWVKYHIKYVRDKRGYEQVRSPRRLVHDAQGDCDCFTTFIGCCLSVLEIPFANRITKYGKDHFQHIYPIVPTGNGDYIVMDCVVPSFNYEEPYKEKKDYKMDLQFLDGIERRNSSSVDIDDLFDPYDEHDIGALSFKNIGQNIKNAVQNVSSAVSNAAQNVAQTVSTGAQTVVQAVKDPKQIIHAVNQINPAVALLRLGFLGSMKLNLMNVAGSLRWAYLSKDAAVSRGIEPAKYDQLRHVLTKAEEIFYGAGGNKNSLREAILTGQGNANREVAGLGYAAMNYNKQSPLPVILGPLYNEEYSDGLAGHNGLGEPVTAAAIAAAASAVGALAILIKNIGDVFKKKQAENPPPAPPQAATAPVVVMTPMADEGVTIPDGFMPGGTNSSAYPGSPEASPPATTSNYPEHPNGLPPGSYDAPTGTFWDKNKSWIKPVGIGVGVLGIAIGGFMYMKKKKSGSSSLSGIGRRKRGTKRRGKKRKKGHQRKSVMTLM